VDPDRRHFLKVLGGALATVTGCDTGPGAGSSDAGALSDFAVPADIARADFAALPDQSTRDFSSAADLAHPADQSPPADFAAPPDESLPPDQGLPADQSMPSDLPAPQDQSTPPDQSISRDLSIPQDQSLPPDLAPPRDLATPSDLTPAGQSCDGGYQGGFANDFCSTPLGRWDIGVPGDYAAAGLYRFTGNGASLLIGRDAGGIYALTSLCTHQCCDLATNQNGFDIGTFFMLGGRLAISCACHGSIFYASDGSVAAGPAFIPLTSFLVSLYCDGHLYVDSTKTVPAGTRLNV